jgi:hypothetical protein
MRKEGPMRCVLVALGVAASLGCGTSTKQALLETAFNKEGRRKDYFEATLRVLDENPKYVDEFYTLAQKHPGTLDRFLVNAAQGLSDERIAAMTAKHLAENPESLRKVLETTLEAAKDKPDARKAIAAAIRSKAALATSVIADDPEAVRATLEGTIDAIASRPGARAAFLSAMQEVSPKLSVILAHNPKTLKVMTKALLGQALERSKEQATEILRELGLSQR